VQSAQGDQQGASPGRKRLVSKFAVFVVVVAAVAAAFGAGALLVSARFRGAEEAWRQDRAGLEAKLATQAVELSAAESRDLLWRLNDAMSTVYINLSEDNFGLARDEMAAATTVLAKASADLGVDAKTQLAPLDPIFADVARSIDALSPDAKSKAREARDFLRKIAGKNGG